MDEGSTTRASLIHRVGDRSDADAWRQFESAYREMLVRFCRSLGVQHADTDDIVQIVFTKLVSGLEGFTYDPGKGRFRDYLFRCVRNALADWAARAPRHDRAIDTRIAWSDDTATGAFEREWIDHHYRRAIARVRGELDARTAELLDGMLVGRAARELAAATGMTEPAIYKAQQRIRDRLRDLIAEQVREEDGDSVRSLSPGQ